MSKELESGTCIIPGLFIGNVEAASSSRLQDIDTIINLSQVIYMKRQDKQYIDIDLPDSLAANIRPVLNRVLPIIHETIMSDKKILVHCCDGSSRSSTIVIAYLIKYYGLSLLEALYYLKNKRKTPSKPNIGFFVQLQDYEMEIFGKISISLPQYSKI